MLDDISHHLIFFILPRLRVRLCRCPCVLSGVPPDQREDQRGVRQCNGCSGCPPQVDTSPLNCTALCYTALPFTALLYTALYCTALYCSALYCSVLPCPAPYTALHSPVLPCPAPYTALPCTALPCPAPYTALPCTALCCTALKCPALPCTALPCTGSHTGGKLVESNVNLNTYPYDMEPSERELVCLK